MPASPSRGRVVTYRTTSPQVRYANPVTTGVRRGINANINRPPHPPPPPQARAQDLRRQVARRLRSSTRINPLIGIGAAVQAGLSDYVWGLLTGPGITDISQVPGVSPIGSPPNRWLVPFPATGIVGGLTQPTHLYYPWTNSMVYGPPWGRYTEFMTEHVSPVPKVGSFWQAGKMAIADFRPGGAGWVFPAQPVPRPVINPATNPAPGRFTQISPRRAPQWYPRNIAIDLHPNGTITMTPNVPPRRPPRHIRESKLAAGRSWYRTVIRVINLFGEAHEAMQMLYGATEQPFGPWRQADMIEVYRWMLIGGGMATVDQGLLQDAIAFNNLEDWAYGAIGNRSREFSQEHNLGVGLQTGPVF